MVEGSQVWYNARGARALTLVVTGSLDRRLDVPKSRGITHYSESLHLI